MDSATLSTRLRDLLKGGAHRAAREQIREIEPTDLHGASPRGYRYVQDDLGGTWAEAGPGRCVIVEREYPGGLPYGRHPIRDYAAALADHLDGWSVLGAGNGRSAGLQACPSEPSCSGEALPFAFENGPEGVTLPTAPRGRILFLDIETTGLSGGAGTYAFLVGCGFFADGAFHTRQFFMSGYEAEHELLAAVRAILGDAAAVVTYNGKTFDLPLMETRYLFHRLDSPFAAISHLDLLHPARRLWRLRGRRLESAVFPPASRLSPPALLDDASPDSCTLAALEHSVLGARRQDDVPGFEIPGRFFHYLRTGDATVVAPVLEHNRLDLLSLAALTAVALRSVVEGPDGAETADQVLALGRVYERAGDLDRALDCHLRAAGIVGGDWDSDEVDPWTRGESLRWLAVRWRRARCYAEAADAWQRILQVERCPPLFVREANYALAVHHEHRSKNLSAAKVLAMEALRNGKTREAPEQVRYRLARLERKLGGRREARGERPEV